jgi:AcrR family transcriptional regulator
MAQPELQLENEITTPTAERILQIATGYFARQGYHGTSVRDIARETGMSVATLYYYIQSKDELYRRVFERQYQEEYELVMGFIREAAEPVLEDPGQLRRLIFRLVDALLDRAVENPDIVRLWTRRWLEKPQQTEDIEPRFSVPLYQLCEDLLRRARVQGSICPTDSNLTLLIHSITWLVYGYCGYGRLSFEARYQSPYSAGPVAEFRQFLHAIVSNLLQFSDQT